MPYLSKKDLAEKFNIKSEVPSETHVINNAVNFLNFPNNQTPEEAEKSFLFRQFPLAQNANRFYNSPNFLVLPNTRVRVLDFNLGKDQNYAEIELPSTFSLISSSYPEGTEGIDERGLGKVYIEQRFLTPIAGVKDIDKTISDTSSILLKEEFKKTLKDNQIRDLGLDEWTNNFEPVKDAIEVEWIYKRPTYLFDVRGEYDPDKTGEVFFDKKTASYCVSVLTPKNVYKDLTQDEIEQAKLHGLTTILSFLKVSIDDRIDVTYIKNKLYYDLARIIDINTESLISEQKIKFLVSVPHRFIAPYINKYVNAVSNILTQINNYLAGDNTATTGAAVAAGLNLNFNEVLQTIINQAETEEQRAALRKKLNITNEFIQDLQNKTFNTLNSLETKYPNLRNTINTTLNSLFVNNFNLDIRLDAEDPFIFINYQKINLENSKKQIVELKRILQELDKQTQAFFQEHEVTPNFDLIALGDNVEKLFDNLYEYCLGKISIKQGITLTQAEDSIEGVAIYLNASADLGIFESLFAQGVPEFFNVIGVEIFHDDSKITLGSSKKEDYTGVYGLTDKTLLFLLFAINEIQQKFPISNLINSVDNEKYLQFIKSCIYPPRKIIFKPNKTDKLGLAGSLKCIVNQFEYAKEDFLNQTAKSRKTLFNLIDSRNKYSAVYSNSIQKIVKDFDELGGASSETIANAIFTLFGNLDTTTLIATLVQCLRAKNVPVELIRKLIDILLLIYNSNVPLLCLLPPIKLPQIPALNIDIQIPVVDLVGGLYKGLLKAVQDLFNQAILELFKRMLDSLLDCEGAFGDLGENNLENVFKGILGQSPEEFGRSSDAVKNDPLPEDSEETQTTVVVRTYSNTNVDRFIQTILQDFNASEEEKPKIIKEMKTLVQKISTSVSTPEFLNLTIGRPSPDVETFIKDLILADNNFLTIKKTNVFSTREGIINVFLKFSSLVDQETLQLIRSSTLQIVTDARVLCDERKVESPDEAMFLAKKFANEQIEIIKTKRLKKQTKTLELIEKFLTPNGYSDLIPPIKCKVNADGTVTPGLIPSEPHPTELYSIEKSIKAPFKILKKNFNKDVEIAKLACLTTVNDKKIRFKNKPKDVELLSKLHPTYVLPNGSVDTEKLFDDYGVSYEPSILVNPLLVSTLQFRTKKTIDREEILFSVLQSANANFNFLEDKNIKKALSENTELYSNLIQTKDKIEKAFERENIKNTVKLQDGIQKIDLARIGYKLSVKNNKLIEDNSLLEIEGEDILSEEIIKIFENLSPYDFAANLDLKRKIFSNILFYNNVVYNQTRRGKTGIPESLDKNFLENVYSSIYNDIEKINQREVLETIIKSPLFGLDERGRTNISKVQLTVEQPEACYKKLISEGKSPLDADLHLLKLENEKNNIVEYYKKNKCFDLGKPVDGRETDILSSYEQGLLNSYIDIFFRTTIYDYYIRAIYAFTNLDIKETKNKLMIDFLYEIISRDKYFKKFKTITRDNKFIIDSYKKQTKKDTATEKEAYKYFIEKNLEIVINTIDKKLIKAGFSQLQKETHLDKIIKNLDLAVVDDIKKEISFDKLELFNEQYDKYHRQVLAIEEFAYGTLIDIQIKALQQLINIKAPFTIFGDRNSIGIQECVDILKKYISSNEEKQLVQTNSNIVGLAEQYIREVVVHYSPLSGGFINWDKPNKDSYDFNGKKVKATVTSNLNNFVLKKFDGNVNTSIKNNLLSFRLFLEKLIELSGDSSRSEGASSGYKEIFKAIPISVAYINASSPLINILKNRFNKKIIEQVDILKARKNNKFSIYNDNSDNTGYFGIFSFNNFIGYYPTPNINSNNKFVLNQEQYNKLAKKPIFTLEENYNQFTFLGLEQINSIINSEDPVLEYVNPLKRGVITDFAASSFEELDQLNPSNVDLKAIFKNYLTFNFNQQDILKLRYFKIFLTAFEVPNGFELFKKTKPEFSKDVSSAMFNIIKTSKNLEQGGNLLLNIKKGSRYYTCAITDVSSEQDRNKLDPNKYYTYKLVYPENPSKNRDVILSVFSVVTLDENYSIDKRQNSKIISIFNEIFRPKIEYTFYVITSICQTSLLPNIDKVFDNSKRLLLKNIRYSLNSAYNYNSSEEDEEDQNSFDLGIIIRGAIALPKVIIKGMAESADPNIAFTSKISLAVKVAKQAIAAIPAVAGQPNPKDIADTIPDIPVPVLSVPLGFTFPFLFTPLTAAYLALVGFGDEEQDGINSKEKQASGNATNCDTD